MSPDDAHERFESAKAGVLREIDGFSDDEFPILPYEIELARWDMDQAYADAWALDKIQQGRDFTGRFITSLGDPDAPRWVAKYAMLSRDSKSFGSVIKSLGDGAKYGREITLYKIREGLRDFADSGPVGALAEMTPEQTIVTRHAEEIAELAKAGDSEFFKRLGETLRRPPSGRNMERKIIRCWLFLALWQCTPPEGYERLKEAADVVMHDMPNYGIFERAWRNARLRRRPKVVDS